jgi:acetyltransferase-like isoleucine patch superfamily enzyme
MLQMLIKLFAGMALKPTKRLWTFVKQAKHAVWEAEMKKEFGHCGKGVRLNGFSTFISPAEIHIGNNVHIGQNAWFRADGGLEIEDNTHMSRNCVIFTANHNILGKRLPYDDTFLKKHMQIG